MTTIEWKNERRRVADLIPWDKNPRKISEEQLGHLKKSIEKFNYAAPIVIDADGRIVAGHMRCRALIALGRGTEEIDVRVASRKLTEEEFQELAIRDNANGGEWDISQMLGLDLNFLKGIGMHENVVNKLGHAAKIDRAEKAPDPPLEAQAKRGEIYQLGAHRVMCGDATDPEDMRRLCAGERADLAFVDPPYNVNYEGEGKNTSTKIQGDNQSEEDFRGFLEASFIQLANFTKAGAALYSCYASRTHREFEDALNTAGFEVRAQIIWVKAVASMGWGDYRWKHEPIFYCHKKGQGVDFFGDRTQYTEWKEDLDDEALLKMFKAMIAKEETDGTTTVWRVKREVNYKHPTQKPVQLVKIAIANSSEPGALVLDTFGGSGSTLIAAEMIGRRAFTMELDPKYVDVQIQRWEEFTGKKAELVQ